MPNLGRFHTHLMLNNTSQTRPRDKVYITIWQNGPCSLQIISIHLKGKVGNATVYRAIKKFLEIGVIEEIRPGLFELSDRFKQHYHYFVCRQCSHRIGFNDEITEKNLQRVATQRHLTLEDHHLELIGLCNKCSNLPTVKPRTAIGTNIRRPLG